VFFDFTHTAQYLTTHREDFVIYTLNRWLLLLVCVFFVGWGGRVKCEGGLNSMYYRNLTKIMCTNKISKIKTLDKRNPLPLTMTPPRFTLNKRKKKLPQNRKQKQMHAVPPADNNPGWLSVFISIGLVRRCFGFE
jgi:hypothetical protein